MARCSGHAPAPQRAASSLLPDPSDWTFELVEEYHEAIRATAKRFGLDTYPNQLEIITAEQMMDAYASVGMPVNYRHWSYGKEFIANEKNYKRGQMGLAYEIVINSDPCISYLMEENTTAMQALVIAHAAYGHNSFFKGNYLFKLWTDASSIIDYLVYSKNYIAECEERHGINRGRGAARQLPRAAELWRRPLSPAEQAVSRRGIGAPRGPARACAIAGQRHLAHAAEDGPRSPARSLTRSAFRPSCRRTSSTSSRRTPRCLSLGSARSCASCARSRSISIRNARRR